MQILYQAFQVLHTSLYMVRNIPVSDNKSAQSQTLETAIARRSCDSYASGPWQIRRAAIFDVASAIASATAYNRGWPSTWPAVILDVSACFVICVGRSKLHPTRSRAHAGF